MVTKVLTSDHLKYCELRVWAKGGGGMLPCEGVANLLRLLALQLWWEKH